MPLFLVALSLASPAAAQPFQSTQLLDTIVAQFTGKPIGVEGGARAAVDTRLKLAQCAAPQLEWRNEMKDAVVIRCMAPEWRIFVPVLAPPRAKVAAPAPTPSAEQPPVVRAAPPPKPEIVIRRGDAITLEAGSPGFSVTREGTAMNDAPAGGRVMVKVDDKKPPIQAVAVETGRARLPGAAD